MTKRTVLVLLALLVLVPASPVTADESNRCGGAWTPDRAECSFVYEGGSVGVGVSLTGDPAGAAVVRLVRVLGRGHVEDVILTCEAAGAWSGCGAGMSSTEPIAPLGARLVCIVEGRLGHGSYGCSSSG